MIEPSLRSLTELLRRRRPVVLTGAGCSTESGIPDYRGPESRWRDREPIHYGQFRRNPAARARYWAGSLTGWPRVAGARPNAAHRALARLEAAGAIVGVITQNVDGLHRAAGSRRVIDLHGKLDRVRCLVCSTVEDRADVQDRLLYLNPTWRDEAAAAGDGDGTMAPDGDAPVAPERLAEFRVPDCRRCGGMLKPDVVFFGENVPRERVEAAWRLYEEAGALLVVGSSLSVYSGRRFVEGARRDGVPIAIVNLGATRSDEAAAVRVDGRAGDVLAGVTEALLGVEHL
jgi:NAD-dependent SIR2 family protein deacetylase